VEGIFSDNFTANLSLSQLVKEFGIFVSIWQSYGRKYVLLFDSFIYLFYLFIKIMV